MTATRAVLVAAWAALAAAGAAHADEPAAPTHEIPVSLALDAAASGGWSDEAIGAVGGRLTARLGPGFAQLSVDAGPPAWNEAQGGLTSLVLIGVGLAHQRGAWTRYGFAGLGAHALRFRDVWGTGDRRLTDAALGVKLGVSRRLAERNGLAPRAGVEATVAWSGADEDRFRRLESSGWVALVAFTIGVELGTLLR